MEEDINNFHCFFPGGGRRPDEWPGEKFPEEYSKIVTDLDKLIEQEGLDVEAVKRERKLMRDLNLRGLGLAYTDLEAGLKLVEESEKHAKQMDKLILPIYRKMLELGYTDDDLIP